MSANTTPRDGRTVIPQQLQDIRELFYDDYITDRLPYVSSVISRNVDTLDELTFDEAEHVINSLQGNP